MRPRVATAEPGRSDGRRDSQAWAVLTVAVGPYAAGMANFAVRLVHGPGWDSSHQIRDQQGWAGHAAFMDGLVDDGFIILGGPVGDGEQTPCTPSRPRIRTRYWLVLPQIPGRRPGCSGSA
jgi:hypothetical protein